MSPIRLDRYRVLVLADTPWFRTIEASSPWAAAERLLGRPMRNVTWHSYIWCGCRATTYLIPGNWITVLHPDPAPSRNDGP